MTWGYEQKTGRMTDPDGNTAASCYSGGNLGKNPEGRNNPDMQDQHNIGPIPVGRYRIGEPLMQSHLGPLAIPLFPDEENEMFGRGGFFIHGDSLEHPGDASEGCVIAPRPVRERIIESDDKYLIVTREE